MTGELRIDLDLKRDAHATVLGGNVDGDEIPSNPSKLETLEAEIADLPLKQIASLPVRSLSALASNLLDDRYDLAGLR